MGGWHGRLGLPSVKVGWRRVEVMLNCDGPVKII